MKLLIAGGGTGGHLYPGVAVAEELLSRDPAHSVLFAGTNRGLEAKVLARLDFPFVAVRAAGLVGTGVRGTVRSVALLMLGLIDAVRILRRFRPQVCLGVGGYVSFPLVAVAWLLGVPSAVQEQNAWPGLTNRLLARVIQRVYAGDPGAVRHFPDRKTRLTGNPLRRVLAARFPYAPVGPEDPVRILVVGGSQGARVLNESVPAAVNNLGRRTEVLHQAGRSGTDAVVKHYKDPQRVRVVEFIEDMAEAYSWAHLVVARAGALTVAELASAGRPAVLVPFPGAAGGHQEANARAAEHRGAAICLLQSELDVPARGEGLARALKDLFAEPDVLGRMAEAAAVSARRDAAREIVDDLIVLSSR
jgi:UDP-N-acetylglucosamine--N-acetylmuramyl-(pentapeptide) pyrophosphoryl-undecaprenol N-acetylglucosamine transferase